MPDEKTSRLQKLLLNRKPVIRAATPSERRQNVVEDINDKLTWPFRTALGFLGQDPQGWMDWQAKEGQWDLAVAKAGGIKEAMAAGAEMPMMVGVAQGGGKGLAGLRSTAAGRLLNQFKSGDAQQMPQWYGKFIQYMAEKYPRMLSHTPEITPYRATLGDVLSGSTVNGATIPSKFRGPKVSDIKLSKEISPETAFHELAHARQNVRNPDNFMGDYLTNNKLMGYHNNPHEVDARISGRIGAEKFKKWMTQHPEPIKKFSEADLNDPHIEFFEPGWGYNKRPIAVGEFDNAEYYKAVDKWRESGPNRSMKDYPDASKFHRPMIDAIEVKHQAGAVADLQNSNAAHILQRLLTTSEAPSIEPTLNAIRKMGLK